MIADSLCLCGHLASDHAVDDEERGQCYVCGCKCTAYWMAMRPPQPPPKPGRAAVWPLVIEDARAAGVSPELLADMRERQEFGLRKYAVQLETHNGRDPLEDAYDEALDGAAYMFQWAEESPTYEERARRRRLYSMALWWAEALCAERQRG